MDLVSIIMPSYNTAEYIAETIKSVLNQTYKEWELIIVDDCSSDNTDDVVATFADSRIRYIKNDKNSGAAISRNRALREANGRWIAFLDSDDLWEPKKLELQITFMVKNNYKFTYTDYRVINPKGDMLPYICTGPDKVTKRKLYNYCYFSTITVIYDREYIGLIQIEDVRKNNDYAMWFKAVEKTICYRFPECLSYYCKRDNSVSSGSKLKLIKYHYIMFRKALHKGKVISVLLTVNNLIHGFIKKIRYRRYISY
ncbi:MAG: glycosyltransferase family 2 protein [Clostridia bacterium]|nr:glycosyltransferase family 2 protein [Clostridia bacterium]